MPEQVSCPECGEEVDPRGLSNHMDAKHPEEAEESVVLAGEADLASAPEAVKEIVEEVPDDRPVVYRVDQVAIGPSVDRNEAEIVEAEPVQD